MRARALVVSAFLTTALTGCPSGPSQGEVIDRYAAQFAARQTELKAAIATAPAAGAVTAPSAPVKPDPAPVFKRKDGEFTMDIVQLEQVDDPTFEFFRAPEKLDLHTSEVWTVASREAAPQGLSADDRASSASTRR